MIEHAIDYACADYPVCELFVHDFKLHLINNEGKK